MTLRTIRIPTSLALFFLLQIPGVAASATGGGRPVQLCAELSQLNGTALDALSVLRGCIERAAENSVLEFPAGVYSLDSTLVIGKSLEIRTQGLAPDSENCMPGEQRLCAQLRASPRFAPLGPVAGLLKVAVPGVTLNHLVIDGNHAARGGTEAFQKCRVGDNAHGFNMVVSASRFRMVGSVTENALCASGLVIEAGMDHVWLERNVFAGNGVHHRQGLWSDGLTALDLRDSVILNNQFVDNTDVDMIFGGCLACRIQGNRVNHSPSFEGSSFAAIMIHAWPTTSGNYTGTDFSGNDVDCGARQRCGFGLLLGAEPWYPGKLFGGAFHDNRIRGAMLPLNVDQATGVIEVYNNSLQFKPGVHLTSCGPRPTSAFNIFGSQVDLRKDSSGRGGGRGDITHQDWKGCILNWWTRDLG